MLDLIARRCFNTRPNTLGNSKTHTWSRNLIST